MFLKQCHFDSIYFTIRYKSLSWDQNKMLLDFTAEFYSTWGAWMQTMYYLKPRNAGIPKPIKLGLASASGVLDLAVESNPSLYWLV